MSGPVDYLILALVFFTLNALSGKAPHGSLTRPKEIVGYWLQGYAAVFCGLYLAVRILAPERLIEGGRLEDGWLWLMTTAACLGWAGGVYFGWWVRRIKRAR